MTKAVSTNKHPRKKREGILQKRILLLLQAGIALGLTRNPKQYFRVAREIHKEWEKINRDSLNRAVRSLYETKLVATKDNRDGTTTLVLSKDGERLALRYNIEEMGIRPPHHWDKKWRIVMFDVPEARKSIRDILRMHFKNMGFYEFQKSVFVHPYPCGKEIEYIVEYYDARKYIRFIVATEIDNALELKQHFNIS